MHFEFGSVGSGTTLVCCTVSLLACRTLIQACSHTHLLNCNSVWLVPKSLQSVHGISVLLQEVMR